MSDNSENQQRSSRQKVFALLPTLLTLGNAVCGFGAITILARVGPAFDVMAEADSFDPATQMVNAAWLIFLAMLFDALDGSAARLTNQTSEFGAMLDSLCDVVSFGVAPAFMMLKLTDPRHRLMETLGTAAKAGKETVSKAADGVAKAAETMAKPTENVMDALSFRPPFDYPIDLLWAIAALYLACAILRLARFNIETDEEDDHSGFSGLPSPAAAAVIAAFPIGVMSLKKNLLAPNSPAWAEPVAEVLLTALAVLLPLITLATAVLMVSRIPYPHLFNQILKGNKGRKQLLQLVFTLALVFSIRGMTVPVLICWFAFAGPIRTLWRRRTGKIESQSPGE